MNDQQTDHSDTRLVVEALRGLSQRIERLEDMLMREEEYTPRHLFDKISHFVSHAERMEARLAKLETTMARMAGAIGLVIMLLPPLTAIFNPLFRKLLGL